MLDEADFINGIVNSRIFPTYCTMTLSLYDVHLIFKYSTIVETCGRTYSGLALPKA
jgi:hypothetical protein